jgi:hypothetical protein
MLALASLRAPRDHQRDFRDGQDRRAAHAPTVDRPDRWLRIRTDGRSFSEPRC